ncbi:conjugative transposon protein TraM [Pedobacter frigiditerrae]|uniref:Conjugative transposon protein TraM n=1 Tax=Pedobacter frigiditerrae TaxID=2530452 RepID=A0A4R0MP48_9SPHI|nr:conjugative transposon protein TraM [Pedobacter frigiditerrae]TCC88585.1 conjugative transposon protein TraM [Pedobacter frigiditerrae]
METKMRDKRKILLVLPLLVMPFLALAFYAAGGGSAGAGSDVIASRGINTALPDADFKSEDPADKMGFYEKGAKDTAGSAGAGSMADRMGFKASVEDERTAEINAKLAQLNREINSPPVEAGGGKSYASSSAPKKDDAGMNSDVDRLEMLMKSMKADKGADPEMEQMNSMLEKLLDIQNPARAQQKVVGKIYGDLADREFLAVPAEIADAGKVVQGSTIRLRLLDSVVLKNVVVPKGHEVFGLCRLVNQRLLLDIKHIRLGNAIVPVELTMYGLDGMPGLAAPDAVFGEVASGGAVDAVGGISVYGMEGIAGQVAGAGIDAAKSLFSRKVKVVRVKLHAGEKVLLRNNRP